MMRVTSVLDRIVRSWASSFMGFRLRGCLPHCHFTATSAASSASAPLYGLQAGETRPGHVTGLVPSLRLCVILQRDSLNDDVMDFDTPKVP